MEKKLQNENTNKIAYAPGEDSDHLPNLIRSSWPQWVTKYTSFLPLDSALIRLDTDDAQIIFVMCRLR